MIRNELKQLYPSTTRVSNKALKAQLKVLYQKYKIDGTAKASDITRFGFRTIPCKIPTESGRVNGLIIIW